MNNTYNGLTVASNTEKENCEVMNNTLVVMKNEVVIGYVFDCGGDCDYYQVGAKVKKLFDEIGHTVKHNYSYIDSLEDADEGCEITVKVNDMNYLDDVMEGTLVVRNDDDEIIGFIFEYNEDFSFDEVVERTKQLYDEVGHVVKLNVATLF